MKKIHRTRQNGEILKSYDFSKGMRGKYLKHYKSGTNLVVLAPDIAKLFPTNESVNEGLRILAELARWKFHLHHRSPQL